MAKIGIIGSAGRMGQAIAAVLEASPDHGCTGGVDQGADVAALAAKSDALVDFSAPAALATNLAAAQAAGIPMLIGTTGFDDSHHAAIDEAAKAIPVLQTGNTSLGVTYMRDDSTPPRVVFEFRYTGSTSQWVLPDQTMRTVRNTEACEALSGQYHLCNFSPGNSPFDEIAGL